jgi:cation diffusion facilitator CzcD-associated flavoprotein CzcO
MEQTPPSAIRLLLYLICSYLLTIIAIIFGFISQFLYWLLFNSFGRHEKRAERKLKCIDDQRDGEYYAVIIGTGFSGLGMAIKLNKLGMDNYILIERHGHVGGTWYVNKYPGCACDVPSNLYSFSFEPNPKWSHYFSRQPEIAEYLEYCTDKYDIRRHIHFNTTVNELRWFEERQLWQVTTQSNNQEKIFYARIIIAGSGPLSNASYPTDIPGMNKFEGKMCHTAKWDRTIQFENKRVAVIGTGASAIQVIPEIQKMNVPELLVFQRTPPWVVPRIDRRLSNFEKRLFENFPILQKFIRRCIYWSREVYVLGFAYRWPIRFINQALVKHNLRMQIKDEQLREKVTPIWDLGCKRVLVTSDWYSTLQKSNVKLITNRIQEIKSHSIITHDGDEYPVDIIIWSTGFETQKFSIPVYGINGCSLAEQWSATMQVYLCDRIYIFK